MKSKTRETSSTTSKDRGIQVGLGQLPRKQHSKVKSCALCSLWTVAVIIGVLATLPVWNNAREIIDILWWHGTGFSVDSSMMEDLGMEGVSLFKQHDRNGDGVLSLEEFEPIAHRLMQVNETLVYDLPIEEWDEVVTVESTFQPLSLESMTKDHNEDTLPPSSLDPLRGLKFWTSPIQDWQNFAVSHLKHFLPLDPYLLENIGEVYDLITPIELTSDGGVLSSNRYIPPPLVGDREIMLHGLLSMFHARPFVYTRFGPQGTVAVVRAQNDRYVDIVFRAHAEFQLNEPPFSPFWFTPAQFTGHIIISKDTSRILFFNMFVPKDRKLNVDMEWLTGSKQDNMEVDIGYMPEMSLRATRTSLQAFYAGKDIRNDYIETTDDYEKSLEQIKWKQEISFQEAARLLEVKLYPFKKVEYQNLTEAFATAQVVQKPVHSILLWGALDDQSC